MPTPSATVSANTLFHFTSQLDYLVGILTNNFFPRFCLENHSAFYPENRQEFSEAAIPMVCFCDIPLSNIRQHVDTYGSYAIGLTKEWGRKNHISPIMYFWDDSISVDMMRRCLEDIGDSVNVCNQMIKQNSGTPDLRGEKDRLIHKLSGRFANIGNGLINVMRFTKQYRGSFYRNGKKIEDVCFYDEREWRYMPDIFEIPSTIPTLLLKEQFMDDDQLHRSNQQLATTEFSLKFNPNDIKYIILNKDDEILPMIRKIEEIKSSKYSTEDIEILKSRIISMEQILQDF